MELTDGGHTIAVVERETGIAKDTLRIWERRYGFPQPGRDGQGERIYTRSDVRKLRIIKRLIDAGHRPGKLVVLDEAELTAMSEPREMRRRMAKRDAFSMEKRSQLKAHLALLEQHKHEQLRRLLSQGQLQMGLARFITERMAPLTQMVSDAVQRDQLPRHLQRVYVEQANRLLHRAIANVPEGSVHGGPRVLLASFNGQHVNLDLLMIEALLSLAGSYCLSLGAQVAPHEVLQAAQMHRAQIVVLSCQDGVNASEQMAQIEALRAALPREQALWASGCGGANRRCPEGVLLIEKPDALADALADWMQSNPAA